MCNLLACIMLYYIAAVGNPVKFKDEPDDEEKEPPPSLGEHNQEILAELL